MALERELKVRVGDDFALPDLNGVVAGLRAVDRGEHQLVATYWDTATLALHAAGFGLRYRTTDGADGHWTLKAQSQFHGSTVVRDEIDIEGDPEHPPREALVRLRDAHAGARLQAVLTMNTKRRIVDLVDDDGRRHAEVADDRVAFLNAGRRLGEFREIELELVGEDDPALVDAALAALTEAGAGDPDPTPKYLRGLRALGHDV